MRRRNTKTKNSIKKKRECAFFVSCLGVETYSSSSSASGASSCDGFSATFSEARNFLALSLRIFDEKNLRLAVGGAAVMPSVFIRKEYALSSCITARSRYLLHSFAGVFAAESADKILQAAAM